MIALPSSEQVIWLPWQSTVISCQIFVEITTNIWHEMTVDCHGSQITCSLDGKAIIPQMQQDTFSRGKIGFWTKSDSVSYFSDTKITYTPLEAPAQSIVRDLLKKHSRLLGVQIYVPDKESGT